MINNSNYSNSSNLNYPNSSNSNYFYFFQILAIVNEKGCDVFGYNTNQIKRQCECICPTCQRPISAQRFAPHLEKCMGMGKNFRLL